ncbi:cation-translocating P-type ATPase [Haloferax sp. DFSO60]|uniref:cation-translocating P-type ATPase n=1 Tax=Haloferax sp. DFSO60 TaxID=3388652 RepID=UPI00397B0AAF
MKPNTALQADESEYSETQWHSMSLEDVFERVEADESGLSTEEATHRLESFGPNEIRSTDSVSPFALFVAQFQDFLIYILVFAALLSLGVGLLPGYDPNYADAVLIFLILFANGIFGFVQDYQAEKSIEALRKLSSPEATVLRDGSKITIDSTELVPGDLVFLEQGNAVSADARLIDGSGLEVDESALTGESTSVSKFSDPLDEETVLADRSNMVYMATSVVRGQGKAVVVHTGMKTEVGGIATQIEAVEEQETPFQTEVNQLGKRLGSGVIALIVFIAVVQLLLTAASPLAVLLVGVTLAVAAVPEGLPAVVTLTLALGSRRMVERDALVRRLSVVESLGSVDVIVTDKTGTLTENQMTVETVYFDGETYDVTGTGMETVGEFRRNGTLIDASVVEPVLRCGAVCNNAERAPTSVEKDFYGDPTEVALLVSAAKGGFGIGSSSERRREIPFSSERKRMTVVVDEAPGSSFSAGMVEVPSSVSASSSTTAYMKGAPEFVLEHCTHVLESSGLVTLTDEKRAEILAVNESFAQKALRVLGFAAKHVDDPDAPVDDIEDGMVFLGLQGMLDPPRTEVEQAIADCRNAGIRVVMATGDNVETAKAIGSAIGFSPTGALTGADIEEFSDETLRKAVESVEVFARVNPEHKVRILEALQAKDHIVGMTGDGVNDGPALRNSDVGIAMGIRGTDVAKQASDMVLLDDNFTTIRDAVAEGRAIFDNIQKFVNYLLSANAGEVLVVFVGVLIGTFLFPELFASQSEALILTPVMLLWINLVTDGFPALALGVDPKADGILDRPPRDSHDSILDREMVASVVSIGVLMTVTGLGVFFYTLSSTGQLLRAQTLLFTFLVVVEVVRLQMIRSRYNLSLFSNRWLIGAIALTLVFQLVVLYTPLNQFFGVRPLALADWQVIAVGFVAFLALNLGVNALFDRFFD